MIFFVYLFSIASQLINKLYGIKISYGCFITFEFLKRIDLKFTFNKKEKLKSKKIIDQLFVEGQSVTAFPLRLVYLQTNYSDGSFVKTGISVSKRFFKTAVDRNRVKRLMREAYRLNKADYFNNLKTSYAFMILYIGKDKPTLPQVESRMKQLFDKFSNKISDETADKNS